MGDGSTGPLLFSSDLGAHGKGTKLALGGSLLPKTLEVPLDSSGLLGGKKLNLGGSLLWKGLGAAWFVFLKSNTGFGLVWICVPLGLPKVVAAAKGFGRAGAAVVGFESKGVAVGLS